MGEHLQSNAIIRRLTVDDRPAFREHLLRLDPESRHDRFHGGASDEFLERYADHCFAPGDVILGAFVEGRLCGAGELRPLDPAAKDELSHGEPGHAEAAFSIERRCRGRGLGAQLFEQLIRAAEANRIAEIDFTCGADNRAMQSLARKFHAELRFAADHVTGRLKARRPSPQAAPPPSPAAGPNAAITSGGRSSYF